MLLSVCSLIILSFFFFYLHLLLFPIQIIHLEFSFVSLSSYLLLFPLPFLFSNLCKALLKLCFYNSFNAKMLVSATLTIVIIFSIKTAPISLLYFNSISSLLHSLLPTLFPNLFFLLLLPRPLPSPPNHLLCGIRERTSFSLSEDAKILAFIVWNERVKGMPKFQRNFICVSRFVLLENKNKTRNFPMNR